MRTSAKIVQAQSISYAFKKQPTLWRMCIISISSLLLGRVHTRERTVQCVWSCTLTMTSSGYCLAGELWSAWFCLLCRCGYIDTMYIHVVYLWGVLYLCVSSTCTITCTSFMYLLSTVWVTCGGLHWPSPTPLYYICLSDLTFFVWVMLNSGWLSCLGCSLVEHLASSAVCHWVLVLSHIWESSFFHLVLVCSQVYIHVCV